MTLKICLVIIITLSIVAIIACIFTGKFFYNLAINPNSSKKMIFSNDFSPRAFKRRRMARKILKI